MCGFCGKFPCDPRCPNADEIIVAKCDMCNDYIYSGYEIYTDESHGVYCSEECAIRANGIRVVEEDDFYPDEN